jgi:general secretion pathway protein K
MQDSRARTVQDSGLRIQGSVFNPLNPESRIPNPVLNPAAGVALLAVMSGITVLVLVALTFASSVQLETRTAIYRKEVTQAYAMATGGVQAALLEIAYPPPIDENEKPRAWIEGQRLAEVNYGHGKALIEIVNETGKLDLNATGPKQLQRLFEARGLEPEDASQLTAAIIHWRSPAGSDDQESGQKSGQESADLDQYYRAAGYRPAHNHFTSVEEVLLVRGMSRDIFYGTAVIAQDRRIQSIYGVGEDLTIYSGSAQVNVNYASEAALLSLPGVGPEMVQAIVQERSKRPFKSMDDLSNRLATSLPEQAAGILTTDSCVFYSIVSVGELNGSRVRRTVKAVVQVMPQGTIPHHRIIAWYDDVTD